jgi:hypothetical protein
MGDGSAPPESFARDCAELGFEIGGWDETTAGIFGHGAEFVGSHAEVMAFLRGWMSSQETPGRDVARWLLPMRPAGIEIPPGRTFQITSRPQRGGFIGERVAIADSVASYFMIDDITVGNRSQFIQAGSIDGSFFAAKIDALPTYQFQGPYRILMTPGTETTIGLPLAMDRCETAMDITFTVTAKDHIPAGAEFLALVVGSNPNAIGQESRLVSATARSAAGVIAREALMDALQRVDLEHGRSSRENARLVEQWRAIVGDVPDPIAPVDPPNPP